MSSRLLNANNQSIQAPSQNITRNMKKIVKQGLANFECSQICSEIADFQTSAVPPVPKIKTVRTEQTAHTFFFGRFGSFRKTCIEWFT
jgi:hypothetical protein